MTPENSAILLPYKLSFHVSLGRISQLAHVLNIEYFK